MVPTTCPEDTDPEAMQAVEESLRLKFQRGTGMSRNAPPGGPPMGIKRQRNASPDATRGATEGISPHAFAPELLLLQQPQQLMATQNVHAQSNALQQGHRQQLLHPQHQLLRSSQQQPTEHPHQQMLQHHQQLLRTPLAAPAPSGEHQVARTEILQQQQMVLSLQGLRTRGQQQHQLLLQQFSPPVPLLPGLRMPQHLLGPSTQLARAPAE